MPEIALLGDIGFNGIISSEPDKNHDRFKSICQLLSTVEHVFANLEVPVNNGNCKNRNKSVVHYADKNVTERLLRNMNISCVSLANNHIYDCSLSGLKATIELLDGVGIKHTGAGWGNEHIEPIIIYTGGIRLGFMIKVLIRSLSQRMDY